MVLARLREAYVVAARRLSADGEFQRVRVAIAHVRPPGAEASAPFGEVDFQAFGVDFSFGIVEELAVRVTFIDELITNGRVDSRLHGWQRRLLDEQVGGGEYRRDARWVRFGGQIAAARFCGDVGEHYWHGEHHQGEQKQLYGVANHHYQLPQIWLTTGILHAKPLPVELTCYFIHRVG